MKLDVTNMYSGIYIIENLLNHKVYIGSSIDLRKRKRLHFKYLWHRSHQNMHLQNAWNKYGEGNFCFWVVEKVGDRGNLIKREQFYLDLFHSFPFGVYNIYLTAGSPLGYKHSEDALEKIKMKSQNISIETRQKLRDANRRRQNRRQTEETKAKIGASNVGKRRTEEVKAKISEALKGRIFSEEHKRRLCDTNVNKGKSLSEETKRKMSQTKRKRRV